MAQPVANGMQIKTRKQVQQAAPPAMSSEEAAMRVRYTSGSNRVGRRLAQIRVHARLVRAVSRAVTAAGGWQSLPGTRADYDVLLNPRMPLKPVFCPTF